MYGLPKDFDPHTLVEHRLDQLCFGQYQLALHFDGDVSITVESHMEYQPSKGETPQSINFPIITSSVMQLLGHAIVNAFGDKEGTLTLEFDNAHVLRCFDQPRYEAYQVRIGTKEIIV